MEQLLGLNDPFFQTLAWFLTLILGGFFFFITAAFLLSLLMQTHHFKNLSRREKKLESLKVSTLDVPSEHSFDGKFSMYSYARSSEVKVVVGSVVISSHFVGRFFASVRNIFGGQVRSLELVLEQARREALVRMKEEAQEWNAHEILNVRIEASALDFTDWDQVRPLGSIEVFAYGTAVRS